MALNVSNACDKNEKLRNKKCMQTYKGGKIFNSNPIRSKKNNQIRDFNIFKQKERSLINQCINLNEKISTNYEYLFMTI